LLRAPSIVWGNYFIVFLASLRSISKDLLSWKRSSPLYDFCSCKSRWPCFPSYCSF
jgi:hypothetical protein